MLAQEAEALGLMATQRKSQATLQISVLWGTIALIVGLLTSVFVSSITHLLH